MKNLKALFPEKVAVHAVEQADQSCLIDSEINLTDGLAPKVLEIFCMGRHAAHLALKEVGSSKLEVKRGTSREPLWPEGYVGSIAHTKGMAIATAASRSDMVSLGIDIESSDREFRYPIEEKIASEKEQTWISQKESLRRERCLSLFSAKEATFKAFFPLEKVYLNFLDVEFEAQEGGFRATLKKSAGQHWPSGFSFDILQADWNGYLVSALTLS